MTNAIESDHVMTNASELLIGWSILTVAPLSELKLFLLCSEASQCHCSNGKGC